MLYVLGELATDRAAALEQQLESSPELGEELLRQADLIANLSLTLCDAAEATALPSTSRSPLVGPAMASLVALAACIALLVINIQPTSVSQDSVAVLSETSPIVASSSEDLLIARAWVDNQFDSVATDIGLVDVDAEVDDLVDAMAEEPSDIDATLSWMFIAVSASTNASQANSLETGASNDG